jgi:hypothetical protein
MTASVSFDTLRELARECGKACCCYGCHKDVTSTPHVHVSYLDLEPNCDAYNHPTWTVVCSDCFSSTRIEVSIYPCPNNPAAVLTAAEFLSRTPAKPAATESAPSSGPLLNEAAQMVLAGVSVKTQIKKRR